MSYLYPATIEQLDKEIDALEKEIKRLYLKCREAFTGGDGWHSSGFRSLEMNREAKEKSLKELLEERRHAKPITKPTSTETVSLGTQISARDASGTIHIFHICTSVDAQLLTKRIKKQNIRMLSTESPLGKKILNEKPGTIITLGNETYTIASIEVSSLL